ncbi:MAG: zinc-dependent peptidase [Myxococcales bacterium]|nr:zinc-dependent peptidase [Myxococcota bacterium]MDW8283703.1 zinc-dependent peptidase [Myxococcales bacterium]
MQVRTPLGTYAALGCLVAAATALALLVVPEVPRWLVPAAALPGLLYYLVASRRERRRRQVLRQPFPLAWREVLLRRVPFYRHLSVQESQRFEEEIQIFLAEHTIYPVPGIELWRSAPVRFTEEHRVLIAASAATLLIGRPEWRLPTTRDIVVYPTSFSEQDYDISQAGHALGMVHAQGPILLSLPALLRGYPPISNEDAAWTEPPPNVGIHEFAHVLDLIGADHGRPTGIPGFVGRRLRERLARQMALERARLEAGRSVLDPYGLKNDAELFAVSVEAFFMDPLRLRTLHAELYEVLAELFNQDPAGRLLPAHWLLRPWFAAPVRYVA